jgi:hypothetical protein
MSPTAITRLGDVGVPNVSFFRAARPTNAGPRREGWSG